MALALLAGLLPCGQVPAWAQAPEAEAPGALVVWRNQFAAHIERPRPTPAAGLPVRLDDQRVQVTGARSLRVTSPDPEVNVVLHFRPLPADAGTEPAAADATPDAPPVLRLTVIVLAEPGRRRFEYKDGGQRLEPEGLAPQRIFRVGSGGLQTALAGAPGRVAELVVQDDAEAELRLLQRGEELELQVLTPAHGGLPSGAGLPYHRGRPLRFADAHLLGAGYTDNGLGELWLGSSAVLRLNAFFGGREEAALARAMVTAQVWRSHRWSLWVEGGAGAQRFADTASGATTSSTHLAAGATLHWRWTRWGAALHAGGAGGATVLALYGHWQLWEHLGLLATAQDFDGHSGLGLGASVGF